MNTTTHHAFTGTSTALQRRRGQLVVDCSCPSAHRLPSPTGRRGKTMKCAMATRTRFARCYASSAVCRPSTTRRSTLCRPKCSQPPRGCLRIRLTQVRHQLCRYRYRAMYFNGKGFFKAEKTRAFWSKHWQCFHLVSSWYRRTIYH